MSLANEKRFPHLLYNMAEHELADVYFYSARRISSSAMLCWGLLSGGFSQPIKDFKLINYDNMLWNLG